MHTAISDQLSALSKAYSVSGATLHNLEYSRALELASDEIIVVDLLRRGFSIGRLNRVDFTKKVSWVDVLVEFKNAREQGQVFVIVTFDPKQDRLIAIARCFDELHVVDGASAALPFALLIESQTVNVVATGADFEVRHTKGRNFCDEIRSALSPFMDEVNPTYAAATPHETRSSTRYETTEQTRRGTTGLTTPGDQDTKEDTDIDRKEDSKEDVSQDSRDDP